MMDRVLHDGVPAALRTSPALLALIALLGLSGCGNLTAGGLAETDVTVSGDAPDPALGAAVSGPMLQTSEDEAEGELEADFLLYLETPDGHRVPITDQPVMVRVDVRGLREEVATRHTVPAGRYTALHIHFIDIEVEIDSGLVVDGTEVTGLVDVEFEAEDLRVARPLDLRLRDGDRVEILVDLNAQDWLLNVDPDLRTVAEQFFADALEIRVR